MALNKDTSTDLTSIKFNAERGVNQMAWKIVRDEHRYIGIVILSLAVFLSFAFIKVFSPIVPSLFTIFVISLLYLAYVRHKAMTRFMRAFAETNGLEYIEKAPLSSVSGKLFDRGHSKSISHVVVAKFGNQKTRLFQYEYVVGRGKESKTYNFTVWEITFEKTEFPHILLRSRKMPRYSFLDRNEKKVSLERGYGKHFQLFVTRKYEIEALQIFTPEVLQMLCEKGANYSIEFAGKSLYIYDDTNVSNTECLREIYEVAREIFDRTGPLINRLHDDFADMHRYYR